MNSWSVHAIGVRIRALVQREDGGELPLAAHRLGVSPDELEAVVHAERSVPNEDVLAAVVRGYCVSACWLLTGAPDIQSAKLPPDERRYVARRLLRIAHLLSDPAWRNRRATLPPQLELSGP